MTKWKSLLCSWKLTLCLSAAIAGCLVFLPGAVSARQLLFAPSSIKPQDFWEMKIQPSDAAFSELVFQRFTFTDQTFFQAISERNCLLVAVNDQPYQAVFPGQSLKLHEDDQLRLLWLVDPALTSQLPAKMDEEQTLIFKNGQLQEETAHE